ncbi:hypothetical protein HDU96_004464 [Phlyctochytrium bullatum]|nr:hypothetical protein HDU96_004464 [Phlyctochytrium bullatum]
MASVQSLVLPHDAFTPAPPSSTTTRYPVLQNPTPSPPPALRPPVQSKLTLDFLLNHDDDDHDTPAPATARQVTPPTAKASDEDEAAAVLGSLKFTNTTTSPSSPSRSRFLETVILPSPPEFQPPQECCTGHHHHHHVAPAFARPLSDNTPPSSPLYPSTAATYLAGSSAGYPHPPPSWTAAVYPPAHPHTHHQPPPSPSSFPAPTIADTPVPDDYPHATPVSPCPSSSRSPSPPVTAPSAAPTTARLPAALTSSIRPHRLYDCPWDGCGKTFRTSHSLRSHLRCHGAPQFPCTVCGAPFRRKHDLHRHARSLHNAGNPHRCQWCRKAFPRADALRRHLNSRSPTHGCHVARVAAAREEVEGERPVAVMYGQPQMS